MRKICSFIILLLLILGLSGCSHIGYKLTQEGDQYYMVLTGDVPTGGPNDLEKGAYIYGEGPDTTFNSLAEMKRDIKYGFFSQQELHDIGLFFEKDTQGRFPVCDINNLWQAIPPDTMKLDDISWSGKTYTMNFQSDDDSVSGFVYRCSQEELDEIVEEYSNYDNVSKSKVLRSEETDRNAVVFSHTDSSRKNIYYTIAEEGKLLHIWEEYNASSVPTQIMIYGSDQGQCFVVSLNGLSQRPTTEWLAEWGLERYSGSEFSVGSYVMLFGIPLLLIGAATIFTLVRRRKKHSRSPDSKGVRL